MASALFLEEPEDINRYVQVFDYLRATALSPQATSDMLAQRQRSWRDLHQKGAREPGTDLSRAHGRERRAESAFGATRPGVTPPLIHHLL